MANSITIFEAEIEALLSLPEDQRGHILSAILLDYAGMPIPELDPVEKCIFTLVNAQVKRAAEMSEKRRNSANARWNNDKPQKQSTNADDMQSSKQSNKNSDTAKNANDMQCNMQSISSAECTNTKTNTYTNTNTITVTERDTRAREEKSANPPEKIQYAEFVTLTEAEHKSLCDRLGEGVTKQYIDRLNNYKGSHGKSYKSDYHVILRWAESDKEQERKQQGTSPPKSSRNPFINAVMEADSGDE